MEIVFGFFVLAEWEIGPTLSFLQDRKVNGSFFPVLRLLRKIKHTFFVIAG